MAPVKKMYVAYYRLSKKGGNGSTLGIDSQRAICRHYYGDAIVKEFEEIKSGKNINQRRTLQQALQYCIENNYILLVAKVDRLSRNTDDVLAIYKHLKHKLACCDIPGELDKFSLTMYAAFAERERELISIRTKNSLDALRRNNPGIKLGTKNPAPLTAERITAMQEGKQYKRNEDSDFKKTLSHLQSLVKQGLTWEAIAADLNASNFCTVKGKPFNKVAASNAYRRYIQGATN